MEAKPLAGRHILLVEDEMMILLMMEEMLIDLGGAAVTSAATVGHALTKIDGHTFDRHAGREPQRHEKLRRGRTAGGVRDPVHLLDRLQRSRSGGYFCRSAGTEEAVSISGIGLRALTPSFVMRNISHMARWVTVHKGG